MIKQGDNQSTLDNEQKKREKDFLFEVVQILQFQNAQQIFALNGQLQNQSDMLKVLPTMCEVEFFKKFCPDNSTLEEFVEGCITKLQYEEFKKGEGVFHFSEQPYSTADFQRSLALTSDKPRAASIIALSDLKLVSLSKYNYKKVFEKKRQQQTNLKIDYFLKIFSQVTRFNMSKFVLPFKEQSLPQNVYLWKEDDDVNSFVVLIQGQVQVEKLIDDPIQAINDKEKLTGFVKKKHQTKIIFSVLSDGHFIGDNDVLLRREKRLYSCRTLQASKFYVISCDDFNLIRKSYPEIVRSLNVQSRTSEEWISQRLEKILDFKSVDHFNMVDKNSQYVERRRVDELEQQYIQSQALGLLDKYGLKMMKRLASSQPTIKSTIRSVEIKKSTKQQLVQQNQKLYNILEQNSDDKGIQKDFNMLKMADSNIQKSLKIRVEKHYENFQPTKPKQKSISQNKRGLTPSFTQMYKTPDSIRDCLQGHKLTFKGDPLEKADFVSMFRMTQFVETQPNRTDANKTDVNRSDAHNTRQRYDNEPSIIKKYNSTSHDFILGRIINPKLLIKTRTISRIQQGGQFSFFGKTQIDTNSRMFNIGTETEYQKNESHQTLQISCKAANNQSAEPKRPRKLIKINKQDSQALTKKSTNLWTFYE